MTRRDLQQLSNMRILEARQLLVSHNYSGAYYLSGYSIECGLKACIARKTRRFDFPELTVVKDSFTHDLKRLVKIAGLEQELNLKLSDATFASNWATVKDWDVETRYKIDTQTQAEEIIYSITSRRNGVLAWIKQRW